MVGAEGGGGGRGGGDGKEGVGVAGEDQGGCSRRVDSTGPDAEQVAHEGGVLGPATFHDLGSQGPGEPSPEECRGGAGGPRHRPAEEDGDERTKAADQGADLAAARPERGEQDGG